jgi:D-alanyl-lipoteichoic acid acyltransferase DltB (MBOAT superfamily)
LWHGFGLAVHRLWGTFVASRVPALGRGAGWHAASVATTFVFVALGWIFFAAPTIPTALTVFANLAGGRAT